MLTFTGSFTAVLNTYCNYLYQTLISGSNNSKHRTFLCSLLYDIDINAEIKTKVLYEAKTVVTSHSTPRVFAVFGAVRRARRHQLRLRREGRCVSSNLHITSICPAWIISVRENCDNSQNTQNRLV